MNFVFASCAFISLIKHFPVPNTFFWPFDFVSFLTYGLIMFFVWCRISSLTKKLQSITWIICQRVSMSETMCLFLRYFLLLSFWILMHNSWSSSGSFILDGTNLLFYILLFRRSCCMVQKIRKLMPLVAKLKYQYMSLERSKLTVQRLLYLILILGA